MKEILDMFPLLFLTATALIADDGSVVKDNAELVGTVQSEGGRPIEGSTIFVSTARLRKGVGVL